MSEIDSGGPAFPHRDWPKGNYFSGLTKIEFYACMALQVMTKNISLEDFEKLKPEELAKGAFVIADAMIRAGKGKE